MEYCIKRVLNSTVPEFLFKHDDLILLINNWQGGNSSLHTSKNIVLKTNFPYINKNMKIEITDQNVDEFKNLVIPSMQLLCRLSLGNLKKHILTDKYAKLVIIQHYLHQFKENISNKNKEACKKIDSYIEFLYIYIGNNGIVDYNVISPYQELQKEDPLIRKIESILKFSNTNDTNEILQCIIDHFCSILNITPEKIQKTINKSILNINDVILNLPAKNETILKNLQGKKAVFKNINRRIVGFRSQIALRPELPQDSILLPFVWAEKFNIYNPKLIDITTSIELNVNDLYEFGGVLLTKRDPAINGASLSIVTRIGFVKSDYVFINIGGIVRKNADFDGDSMFECEFWDKSIVIELFSTMHPKYNIFLYNESRITFTESHILYMHQRNVSRMKHAKIYEIIRNHETKKWISDKSNRLMIEKFNKYATHDIFKLIEPTKIILETFLNQIYFMYGSVEAYNTFEFINLNILLLSNNNEKSYTSLLYDPNLPLVYFATADVLCENLCRICLSGAAGSIHILNDIVDTFVNADNTVEITDVANPYNPDDIFVKFFKANKNMALKSREVPLNGAKFKQLNIAWDLIEFKNGNLYFAQQLILENVNSIFDSKMFLNPDDLFYFLMSHC